MLVRLGLGLLALGALGACDGAVAIDWRVEIVDDGLRASTRVVQARIARGPCPAPSGATEIYLAEVTRPNQPAGEGLMPLTPGDWCFSARGRNAACEWTTEGFATVTVSEAGTVVVDPGALSADMRTVVLRLEAATVVAACPTDVCTSGVCGG